jgi:hypothetical protein
MDPPFKHVITPSRRVLSRRVTGPLYVQKSIMSLASTLLLPSNGTRIMQRAEGSVTFRVANVRRNP